MDGFCVTPDTLTNIRSDPEQLAASGSTRGAQQGSPVRSVAAARHLAREPLTAIAPAGIKRRRLAAQLPDHTPAPHRLTDGIDFSDPQLRVNCVAPDYVPADRLLPGPDLKAPLEDDVWLLWLGTPAAEARTPDSVRQASPEAHIRAQLQERARIEACGEEFVFAPCLVTLKNMQTFLLHIREEKQFPDPLTADEVAALGRLEEQTTALLAAHQPCYKRTVCLSLSLMILCEIITERQVLSPRRRQTPALFSRITTMNFDGYKSHSAQWLAALPWSPPAPDSRDLTGGLSMPLFSTLRHTLLHLVNDKNRLIWPSFQPLTITHFCYFAHLPVHPVGLTVDYACSADGLLMSPLKFAEHDLDHMLDMHRVGRPGYLPPTAAESLLCCYDQRLLLRQLLLDDMPDCLTACQLRPALTLLLFLLLHEAAPASIAQEMTTAGSPFFFFLNTLAQARRDEWNSYTDSDVQCTDREALMAALWAARVWEQLLPGQAPVTRQRLHDSARSFVRNDLPRLHSHLDFFKAHEGTLRQLFINCCEQEIPGAPNSCFFTGPLWPQGGIFTVFQNYREATGLRHLDHSDLAYVAALHSPALCQKMTSATGASLPQGTLETAIGPQDPLAPWGGKDAI